MVEPNQENQNLYDQNLISEPNPDFMKHDHRLGFKNLVITVDQLEAKLIELSKTQQEMLQQLLDLKKIVHEIHNRQN